MHKGKGQGHANGSLWVKNIRPSLRTIASRQKKASYGKKVRLSATWARFLAIDLPAEFRCWSMGILADLFRILRKLAITGNTRTDPMTTKVQNSGCSSINQARNNRKIWAGGTRLRRRLSRIFQRDSPEIGLSNTIPPGPGTRVRSQLAICQSPLIHLCLRLTSEV